MNKITEHRISEIEHALANFKTNEDFHEIYYASAHLNKLIEEYEKEELRNDNQ